MKTAQLVASNVWIQFNNSLLHIEYRDDRLQLCSTVQNPKVLMGKPC